MILRMFRTAFRAKCSDLLDILEIDFFYKIKHVGVNGLSSFLRSFRIDATDNIHLSNGLPMVSVLIFFGIYMNIHYFCLE